VLLLVIGNFVEDVLLGGGEAGHLRAAGNGAWIRPCIRSGKAGTGRGVKIELSFEILKVEREVENVRVAVGRGWWCDYCSVGATCQRSGCPCGGNAGQETAPIDTPLVKLT